MYFISGELVQNITLLIKSLRVENLNLPDLPDFIPNLPLVGESIASYWVTLQDNFFDVIKTLKLRFALIYNSFENFYEYRIKPS